MNDYVAVIGAANIDIGGQPFRPLAYKDSNCGKISIGFGGVGRNIAHNLCRLGVPVKLFTAVGGDALGKDLLDNCRDLGMDVSNVLVNESEVSSMYMFINDEQGDMALAISHVRIDEDLTPEYFSERMDVINNAKIVIVDCNISEESFRYLAKNCTAPIFVDPVAQDQSAKIGDSIGLIDTIKPNSLEAEFLTGMTIETVADAKAAAVALLDTGIRRVFLSMAEDGIVAASDESIDVVPSCTTDMVCTTGAGDSSMAAIVWSFFNGNEDMTEAAQAANAAASLTIGAVETISPEMSESALISKIKENY